MSDLRLSAREVEDVLAGRQPDGRADLAPLAEVAALLHASREVEPPPPMSDDLLAEIERGVRKEAPAGPRHSRRHKPRHMAAVPARRRAAASVRRPVVSLGAAAALLVGLVVVTSMFRPGGVDSAVSDVGSAIGLDVFRGDSAAQDASTTTTSSTTTTVPPTTTAPPQTTTTVPPAPGPAPPGATIPGAGQDPRWWFSPEAWELFRQYWPEGGGDWDSDSRGYDSGPDGDRDGDRDGRGGGHGGGGGDNRTSNNTQGGAGSGSSSTTMAPSSSTSWPSTTTTGGGSTTP